MFYLVTIVVVAALAVALAPKPPEQTPPSLEDIDVPSVKRGKPIPKVFGTVIIDSPTNVSYSDIGYHPVKTKGGK